MEKNIKNTLFLKLGESDALVEYTEVLVRLFEKNKMNEEDFQNIANRMGITVNDVQLDEVCRRIRNGYIASVHTYFDKFCDGFIKLESDCGCPIKKEEKKSNLYCIYKDVFGLKDKKTEEYAVYQICDYYRLVRNRFIHNGTEEMNKAFTDVSQRKELLQKLFGNREALKSPGEIFFDDFILYSMAAKWMSEALLSNKRIDETWIAQKMVEKYKKGNLTKNRLINAVRNDLKQRYLFSEEETKPVVEIIKNIP